ncbi:MAG: hypothetical protein RIT24_1123 [Planctomycetota bacterium]|jgi:hypothetical protein
MRSSILALWAFALPLLAQSPAASSAEDSKPRPRLELAKALRELDQAVELLRQASQRLQDAEVHAAESETQSKAVEIEEIRKIATEARERASALKSMCDEAQARLGDLIRKGKEEAPDDLLVVEDPVLEAIRKTTSIAEPKQARAELEKIDEELRKRPSEDRRAQQLRGLVQYELGEAYRREGSETIKQGTMHAAEKSLILAHDRYEAVLKHPDWDESGHGSSLHACALRRCVQVQASIWGGYDTLSTKQPNVKAHEERKKKAAKAGNEAHRRLKKDHANAVLEGGQSALAAAEQDFRELGQDR